jgi:hypothetical protein
VKYWTIQTKDVIETVNEKGIFQPDFDKSRYLSINSNLKDLYYLVLKSFNKINSMDLHGVVYAFTQSDGKSIYSIKDIDEFYTFMKASVPVTNLLTYFSGKCQTYQYIYSKKIK